eukprot:scaffold73441_cov54-Phaeocystis_antarctica.AAC.2
MSGIGLTAVAVDDVLDGAAATEVHDERRGEARHQRGRGGDATGHRHRVVAEVVVDPRTPRIVLRHGGTDAVAHEAEGAKVGLGRVVR